MNIIEVENLVKKYKNGVQALNGTTLSVKEGEIFTLLGQNGAGKSTLINILTTFLSPTSGKVNIIKKDLYKNAKDIRSQIACVAQKPSIDEYLSLEENMMFQSKLYKVNKNQAVDSMKYLIECFDLEKYMKYPVCSYSGGVKRRLDIALNMMSNPKIIFLDEPTVGMDLQSRLSMWNMMKKVKQEFGTTIFLTTHYLEEADKLSDTICIMKNGKNVVQGTTAQLKNYLNQESIEIRFLDKEKSRENFKLLKEILKLNNYNLKEDKIVINSNLLDLKQVINLLLEHNISFCGVDIVKPNLEDIFLEYTKDSKKEVV